MRRPALLLNESSLCGLRSSRCREGKGPECQVVSRRGTADRSTRDVERLLMRREKKHYQEQILVEHLHSKGATYVILMNHASVPVRKKRLSPSNKARPKANRNKFAEESGMPDRIKCFRKVDC